jgi:hypothetical protein
MTVEQLTLVCVGVLVNGCTFALGLLAGASLRKKGTTHDRDSYEDKARQWHKASPN